MTARKLAVSRTNKLQRLFELASNHAGYFTAGQARGLGYSARSLVHHVAAGHFERISRGFYRLVGFPADSQEDIVAAWLRFAPRRAVVSHDTALALYELAPSRSHEIHLTLPRDRRPRTAQAATAVKLHTSTVPLGHEEVANRFGVEVTSPARTIADVADIGADPSVVVEATARALNTGLVSENELHRAVKRRSTRIRQLVERAIKEAGAPDEPLPLAEQAPGLSSGRKRAGWKQELRAALEQGSIDLESVSEADIAKVVKTYRRRKKPALRLSPKRWKQPCRELP